MLLHVLHDMRFFGQAVSTAKQQKALIGEWVDTIFRYVRGENFFVVIFITPERMQDGAGVRSHSHLWTMTRLKNRQKPCLEEKG